MGIVAGDSIILQVSTFEDRFLGVVTCVRRDGRIVARVVLPSAVLQRVAEDTRVSLKYVWDGRLLGYATHVLRVWERGETLVELDGPGTVFDAEERAEPRYRCLYPAHVVKGEYAISVAVEDISLSCARVRVVSQATDFPVCFSQEVVLTIDLLEGERGSVTYACSVVKAFMKNGERYFVLRFNPDDATGCKDLAYCLGGRAFCLLPLMRI